MPGRRAQRLQCGRLDVLVGQKREKPPALPSKQTNKQNRATVSGGNHCKRAESAGPTGRRRRPRMYAVSRNSSGFRGQPPRSARPWPCGLRTNTCAHDTACNMHGAHDGNGRGPNGRTKAAAQLIAEATRPEAARVGREWPLMSLPLDSTRCAHDSTSMRRGGTDRPDLLAREAEHPRECLHHDEPRVLRVQLVAHPATRQRRRLSTQSMP